MAAVSAGEKAGLLIVGSAFGYQPETAPEEGQDGRGTEIPQVEHRDWQKVLRQMKLVLKGQLPAHALLDPKGAKFSETTKWITTKL